MPYSDYSSWLYENSGLTLKDLADWLKPSKSYEESNKPDLSCTLTVKTKPKKQPDVRIKRIIPSGPATVVFFMDGDKVVVKKPDDKEYDIYEAVSAAIAIHLYGSNSQFKKAIERHMDDYLKAEAAKKKEEVKKANKQAQKAKKKR